MATVIVVFIRSLIAPGGSIFVSAFRAGGLGVGESRGCVAGGCGGEGFAGSRGGKWVIMRDVVEWKIENARHEIRNKGLITALLPIQHLTKRLRRRIPDTLTPATARPDGMIWIRGLRSSMNSRI